MTTKDKSQKQNKELSEAFDFFKEIGIISQLSKALFEQELPKDLQVIHFSILNNLTLRGDGKLPSDLAKAFQLPRSNMTDILRKLEQKGYVQFASNPNDGRSKCIYLTPEGHNFRQQAIKSMQGPTKKIGEKYDLKKLSAMKEDLVELRQIMDEDRNN